MAGRKKKARRQQAWIAFQDESGISERPPVRRTWAPRGETPVLIHAFNWKKMSASAVLAYRWDGKRSQLFFQVKPDSYNTNSLIAFLEDLRRHFRGRKVILVWDGLPSHRSREMTDYLRGQTHWLIVERLPGYAPHLNPVEYLWGNVKGQELANLCADNLGHATSALCTGMTRVRHRRQLCFSFLHAAGLSF
ncbi:MAG: IS630 family transposase [Candidatus Binatia bacterium]